VRLSFVEGVCLVAIGVAMVELQDGHRFARPGITPGATVAVAAKPAAAARVDPLNAAAGPRSHEGRR
jgi:hypothetical protein